MGYKVIVDVYEGPLDLLLSLIQKSEIDIYDIPINTITDQFLNYIYDMEEMNLEITSDFLVMASTLLEIKSKMLLPQEKVIVDGVELDVDPREDLVQKLLEYKLFKEAAEKLKTSELIESKVYYKPREDLSIFSDPIDELGKLDLNILVKTFNKIMERKLRDFASIDIREIQREEITLDDCMREIKDKLNKNSSISFNELLKQNCTREEIITYFLSLLELIKSKFVFVEQINTFSDLIIKRRLSEVDYGQ
jgi:segregation and condensation protein A